METVTIKDQKVNLVEGTFTPSEAADVISSLIREKINFHKIQRLSWCEGDQNANTEFPDGRIGELQKELADAKAFINQYRQSGVRLKIEGQLTVSIAE
ncbi:hypothetical protein J1N09_08385 [Aureitalea sp. L0-47]|jgi:hypothetical protein|uniref:hypothetical protein n=1 Tax=Aureitalea sp. L0-47 TaxID=2816962 RepID=UPI0022376B86|nr:hypothetical protein [Aureitalea sp. L0-47]MCW5519854.1 hypothetical protein [Aureitalea sp. L0-47]